VAHERYIRPQRSRWHKGVTTFGPGVKVALTLLMLSPFIDPLAFNPFFVIAYVPITSLVLWGIWRKDEVDTSDKGLLRRGLVETRDSFIRDKTDEG
jgi:hypothetical protein